MSKKKAIFGVLLVVIVVVLFMVRAKVFGHVAEQPTPNYPSPSSPSYPYCTHPIGNIMGWYDETWQAHDYYVLVKETSVLGLEDNYRYVYTQTPTDETLTFPNPTPGASYETENDVVVTKWRATAHIHFGSTGM